MIKLESIELSSPFRLAPRVSVKSQIIIDKDVKCLELNEQSGLITITLTGGKRVFTSMSNAKAAFEHVSETPGTNDGTKGKGSTKGPKQP